MSLAPTNGTLMYSVVIPVYNSVESLPELYERIRELFDHTLLQSFELVFVDDASPNLETWNTLHALHQQDSRVRVFQLLTNVGQHNATMLGLKKSRGQFVITMDDDLQHQPENLPELIQAYGDGTQWDAVFAVASNRDNSYAPHRNLGSWLFNKLMNATIPKPADLKFSSFRLMNRALCDAILQYQGFSVTMNSLICMYSRRIANVTVEFSERKFGTSGYSFFKLISLAFNHIFNFSAIPLKLISIIGGIISVLALFYTVLVLYWKLTGQIGQTGFATTVILISFFSGTILLSMGIMGQYLIRILRTTTMGMQFSLRSSSDNEHD